MVCEFYEYKERLWHCDQTNIPRVSDGVVIENIPYDVVSVCWNYDTRIIRIELERID